ncbi:hypothetical protein GCM10027073_46370 [Streptomyces chlorus]
MSASKSAGSPTGALSGRPGPYRTAGRTRTLPPRAGHRDGGHSTLPAPAVAHGKPDVDLITEATPCVLTHAHSETGPTPGGTRARDRPAPPAGLSKRCAHRPEHA